MIARLLHEGEMTTTATIPVTVRPEAAERVAELNMQRELEQMVEHTKQTVPGLRSIEVQLALPYDTGAETSIIIEATMDKPTLWPDSTLKDWSNWKIETFQPEVWTHFNLMFVLETVP